MGPSSCPAIRQLAAAHSHPPSEPNDPCLRINGAPIHLLSCTQLEWHIFADLGFFGPARYSSVWSNYQAGSLAWWLFWNNSLDQSNLGTSHHADLSTRFSMVDLNHSLAFSLFHCWHSLFDFWATNNPSELDRKASWRVTDCFVVGWFDRVDPISCTHFSCPCPQPTGYLATGCSLGRNPHLASTVDLGQLADCA